MAPKTNLGRKMMNASKAKGGWYSRVAAEFTPDELVAVVIMRIVDVAAPIVPGRVVVATLLATGCGNPCCEQYPS
jgi:hypothetical protein